MDNGNLSVSLSAQQNGSEITYTFAPWSPRDIFYFCFDASAFVLNALVLFLLWIDRANKTSFKVYIGNLCTINVYYAVVGFVGIVNNRMTFPLEPPWLYCAVLRFMYYITAGLVHLAHFLIAVNRVWAVAWPVTYRHFNRNNTVRNPVVFCIGMWVYSHLFVVPAVVLDTLTIPRILPDVHHCVPAILWNFDWAVTAAVLLFHSPVLVTLMLYPYILYKTIKRRSHRVRNQVAQSGLPVTSGHQQTNTAASEVVDELSRTVPMTFCGVLRRRAGHGQFLTLSLLTVNVALFLFPGQIYHILLLANIDPPGMMEVTDTMYILTPTVDSLLFLFTVKSLRDTLRSCTTHTYVLHERTANSN